MKINPIVFALMALMITVPCFAAWSLSTYPTESITPGSTFATGGDCESEVGGSIELRYRNGENTVLVASHNILQEPTIWEQEFDPTTDYNPPGSWPNTVDGDTSNAKILQLRLMKGTEQIVLRSFECDEIE